MAELQEPLLPQHNGQQQHQQWQHHDYAPSASNGAYVTVSEDNGTYVTASEGEGSGSGGGLGLSYLDPAPLLVSVEKVEGTLIAVEEDPRGRDSFWPCTFNLAKVIMGAGMNAVPKAFYLLGIPSGVGILVSIAGLSFFTLSGLVGATERTGARSYAALARRLLGRKGELALTLAIFLNCFVMLVVFLVVVGDVLVGNPELCNGLICELTGVSSGPLVDRRVLLGALSLLVLGPLASQRTMEGLAIVNIAGVCANGLFACSTIALAAAAITKGAAHALPLAPQWDLLSGGKAAAAAAAGAGGAGGRVMVGLALAAVVPVLLNCDVCHQSLHPLMPILRPYSSKRMRALVAAALTICNALYLIIAIGCCLAFGPDLHSDVLENINPGAMAPLVGQAAALAIAYSLRFGYLLSLVGSYVLLCYPLRECIVSVALISSPSRAPTPLLSRTTSSHIDARTTDSRAEGHHTNSRAASHIDTRPDCRGDNHHMNSRVASRSDSRNAACTGAAATAYCHWTLMTWLLVGGAYGIAAFVASIWGLLALVGATASTVQAFIIPGLIILKTVPRTTKPKPLLKRALAWFVVVLGALLFVNGLVHEVVLRLAATAPAADADAGGSGGLAVGKGHQSIEEWSPVFDYPW